MKQRLPDSQHGTLSHYGVLFLKGTTRQMSWVAVSQILAHLECSARDKVIEARNKAAAKIAPLPTMHGRAVLYGTASHHLLS